MDTPRSRFFRAGRKRKAAVVESEGSEDEAASGSEYAASSGERAGRRVSRKWRT